MGSKIKIRKLELLNWPIHLWYSMLMPFYIYSIHKNWNIPIHILEGYSMPCSLTAIFWPSSKHCQQKGKGKDSIDNKQLSINIVGYN